MELVKTLTWKEKVAYIAWEFLHRDGHYDPPVKHIFEPCMYIREICIAANTMFIGRVHRHGHDCELVSGECVLISEAGFKRVQAPFRIRTEAGHYMVLFAVTDMIGRTYHPNPSDSRDVPQLEADAFESVESFTAIGRGVTERIGYWKMLEQMGIDEAPLKPLIENEADQIPFPQPVKAEVRPSLIHGKGLMATGAIVPGEIIAPVRVNEHRTPAGRWTNHGFTPNAMMRRCDDRTILLIATAPIEPDEEITIDYRHSVAVGAQP